MGEYLGRKTDHIQRYQTITASDYTKGLHIGLVYDFSYKKSIRDN
jgi:hypothetical protein